VPPTSAMRLALLFVAACLVDPAAAQDDVWITVGHTDKMTWHVKAGSVTVTEMQANVPVVMVVGRITVHATSRTTLYKWYIPVSECEGGMGQVVVLSIGGEYRYKQDFTRGDGSAASGLAEYICGLHEDAKVLGR
jgi:hypothetical protein